MSYEGEGTSTLAAFVMWVYLLFDSHFREHPRVCRPGDSRRKLSREAKNADQKNSVAMATMGCGPGGGFRRTHYQAPVLNTFRADQ